MPRGGLLGFVDTQVEYLRDNKVGRTLTRPALLQAGLVGSGDERTYAVDVAILGQSEPMRNVPIASGNRQVFYADVGSAVTVLRNPHTGKFEVTGFAKQQPGRFVEYPINLSTGDADPINNLTLESRLLTYAELETLGGGYGSAPYGAVGIFRGGTLIEVRS